MDLKHGMKIIIITDLNPLASSITCMHAEHHYNNYYKPQHSLYYPLHVKLLCILCVAIKIVNTIIMVMFIAIVVHCTICNSMKVNESGSGGTHCSLKISMVDLGVPLIFKKTFGEYNNKMKSKINGT